MKFLKSGFCSQDYSWQFTGIKCKAIVWTTFVSFSSAVPREPLDTPRLATLSFEGIVREDKEGTIWALLGRPSFALFSKYQFK